MVVLGSIVKMWTLSTESLLSKTSGGPAECSSDDGRFGDTTFQQRPLLDRSAKQKPKKFCLYKTRKHWQPALNKPQTLLCAMWSVIYSSLLVLSCKKGKISQMWQSIYFRPITNNVTLRWTTVVVRMSTGGSVWCEKSRER